VGQLDYAVCKSMVYLMLTMQSIRFVE
jgi:hypothetical protein